MIDQRRSQLNRALFGYSEQFAVRFEHKFLVPFAYTSGGGPFPEDKRLYRAECRCHEFLQAHTFSIIVNTISSVAGQATIATTDIECCQEALAPL